MNFDFPDDVKEMREEAKRFLAAKCPPGVPRKILDHGGSHDKALWSEIGAMGWLGCTVPEAYGGSGLGHLATCALAEEIGFAIAPVPFASTVYLGIEALLLFGSEAQKQAHLPKLANGQAIATFAVAELPGPFVIDRLKARHTEGRLTGSKLAVADGDVAALAIVVAQDQRRGACLCLVDLTGAGVKRDTVPTVDPSRSHANITFDGAKCEVLDGCKGTADVRRLIDRAAIMMAFEQVGGAQAALDMATGYAKERYAFGRPIGSFQAIKHKLADMYVAIELARSNAYYGAWALNSNAAELAVAAAVARIAANDAGWLATKENVQTHGGMGFTWEGDAHLYYRRAKLLGVALGGSSEWKRRLMGELKSSNAALAHAD
ncbi:MAG: acyl-CoA dehydrogenase family protein [Hyphomicrobiaceae bacterium]